MKKGSSLESQNKTDFIEMCTPDKSLWLRIRLSELNKAYEMCSNSGDLEIGGVLIGLYSKNKTTCTAEKFLPPTPDSRQGKYNFELGIIGLKEIFTKFWNKKKYYIGDWHFHPKSSPTPSQQDLKQLKKISNSESLKCESPLMIIIGEKDNSFIFSATIHLKKHGPISFQTF